MQLTCFLDIVPYHFIDVYDSLPSENDFICGDVLERCHVLAEFQGVTFITKLTYAKKVIVESFNIRYCLDGLAVGLGGMKVVFPKPTQPNLPRLGSGEKRRYATQFGDLQTPANMAGQRPPDPHHLPPDIQPVLTSPYTSETATGNASTGAATGDFIEPNFSPYKRWTREHQACDHGGSACQVTPLSQLQGSFGVAQPSHELQEVHSHMVSQLPASLASSASGPTDGVYTAAAMASQLSQSFSPMVQLSKDVPTSPMMALAPYTEPLNVGNGAMSNSHAFASGAPSVRPNAPMTTSTSSADFLQVKVPLAALSQFNWKDIAGAELKGLIDSSFALFHLPFASLEQFSRYNVQGAVFIALMGPDGSVYGDDKPVSYSPITQPHLLQHHNLELPHERKARLAQEAASTRSQTPGIAAIPGAPMQKERVTQASKNPSLLGPRPTPHSMAVTPHAHARLGGLREVSFAPSNDQAKEKHGVAHMDVAKTGKNGVSSLPFDATVLHTTSAVAGLSHTTKPGGHLAHQSSPLHKPWQVPQRQIQFNGQFPMRLFRWSPELNVKTESSVAPVWVTFPNLRADLFNGSVVHQLCKHIGRCLKVDVATSTFSRPNVAKARVEIDLLKPRVEQIWIGFSDAPGEEDVGMFQLVEYERIPKYCTACFKQGHEHSTCNTLTPSQPDKRTVVVVPQPSTTAHTTTQPSRRRRSRSRVRRQREGKGIAIDEAGTGAGGSHREESHYVWREKTAKGSRPIEVVDVDGLGKGEGLSSSLQVFVPTSSHPSPNVVIPNVSLAPSTVNATPPTLVVVVVQSASRTVEPSVPPIGVEQGSVIASLPLSTSSSSPIVHVPDPQPLELALAMYNTFDALAEMPGDSHEVCNFNTVTSSIPSNSVRREDDECSSQTSDGSTIVYAKCKYRNREPLWEYLRETHAALPADMAWGVVGDFNCLLDPSEKKGGRPYAPVKYRPFVECVEDCELVDSPFIGEDYTWLIRSRIDRLLFNQPWMDMFSCLVHHLDRVGSDHAPLLVECKSNERPPTRPFTFLNVWTEHEDFQGVVADSWREDITGSPMFVFGAMLKRLANSLKRWNRDTFGHIFDRLKALEQDVRDIELQLQTNPSDGTYIEFKRRFALLKRQYRIEDEYWRQKAHAKWVTDGERNSGYFHSIVKDRRRKLYIHRIQDDSGQWVTERAAIATQAITFFQAMFTADPSVTSSALDIIPRLVTDANNDRLCAVPEMEEVKTAVFAMDSRSAAGPDGYTGAFYKAAWTIICMDLLAMEMCHGMRVDNEDVILKLDMMKAYDRVSWYFLMSVLRRFGFSETWIDLVYRAISNICFPSPEQAMVFAGSFAIFPPESSFYFEVSP
ncbi:unnamed protein product [Cuscuta campestris]|uniref:Uncharacterized protein n=1 Tax=Cuscuta campestris TaxID=132261 RepID=A0A484MK42_9ASTE|nr:unnamed protein product [Cuscuta campestris]